MQMSTTVERRVDVPRAALYDVFIPIELERILGAAWPVPAVTGTSRQSGPWDVVGSSRVVHLADGSTAREEVTHVERPAEFGYRVADFTNPIRLLAAEARGEWRFSPAGRTSTDVVWRYTFAPRTPVAEPVLAAVVRGPWRRFMRRALASFAAIAEAEAGAIRR